MDELLKDYPPLMCTKQVSQILGVTVKTTRELINQGVLPAIRLGRIIRIPKNKLITFLEGN